MAQKQYQKKHKKAVSSHRHHHKFKLLKYGVLFILFLAIGITLFVYSVYAGLWGKLPDYAELRDIRNDEASELYSEDNLLIGKIMSKTVPMSISIIFPLMPSKP